MRQEVIGDSKSEDQACCEVDLHGELSHHARVSPDVDTPGDWSEGHGKDGETDPDTLYVLPEFKHHSILQMMNGDTNRVHVQAMETDTDPTIRDCSVL